VEVEPHRKSAATAVDAAKMTPVTKIVTGTVS
jgi:hypothetical protein